MRPYVKIGVGSQHGSGEPTLQVSPFDTINSSSARIYGTIDMDNSLRAVHEYGFVYKEGRALVSIGDTGATKVPVGYSSLGAGANSFNAQITGLARNRVWAYRPYVITAAGVFYSSTYYGAWTGLDIEWALVAGGGSGGSGIDRTSGGGGSGGYRTGTYAANIGHSHTYTVGAGGAAGNNNGGLSAVLGNSNGGGGHGGFNSAAGASGASGGGGHHNVASAGGGSASYGNNGGVGYDSGNVNLMFGAGGGGGAGSAGGNASSSTTSGSAGNGGSGVINNWTGTNLSLSGGGGGGAQYGINATSYRRGNAFDGGGKGASVAPADTVAFQGQNGLQNTGGGGGGGAGVGYNSGQNPVGGAGGSGVVIIRFLDGVANYSIGSGLLSQTGTVLNGSDTYRWIKFTAGSDSVTWG